MIRVLPAPELTASLRSAIGRASLRALRTRLSMVVAMSDALDRGGRREMTNSPRSACSMCASQRTGCWEPGSEFGDVAVDVTSGWKTRCTDCVDQLGVRRTVPGGEQAGDDALRIERRSRCIEVHRPVDPPDRERRAFAALNEQRLLTEQG